MDVLEIREGEVYRMRRAHPCGGLDFRIFRTGADIGIECVKCGRRVLVDRRRFESRARALVTPAAD